MSAIQDVVRTLMNRKDVSLSPTKPYSVEAKRIIEKCASIDSNQRAVLDLMNDDIEACHLNVQDRETDPSADYMHAILHRREKDWWNSRDYWLARVSHPVVNSVFGSKTAAKAYYTRVEKAEKSQDVKELLTCQDLQWQELASLAAYHGLG